MGFDAIDDQMRHAMRESAGLSGSRPGYDQERTSLHSWDVSPADHAVFDGPSLFRIEPLQMGYGH
jgi:hypothetical protein